MEIARASLSRLISTEKNTANHGINGSGGRPAHEQIVVVLIVVVVVSEKTLARCF
jgi:hypothetical protein